MEPFSNVVIEEIDIISFGKLEKFDLKLNSALNVIYGKNESGKSTIQLFIKAMLYGLPTRKKSGEFLKERDRAIPWSGNRAEGMMKVSADGRSIEIRRRFGKTAAADRIEVCDAVTGEPIEEYADGNIGEKLLGIPCDVFENTMWIRQSGILVEDKTEELSARLMNIQSSGDERVSAERALAALAKEKRRLKAKDGRSAKGRIDELTDRREECRRQKYDLATRLAQNAETDKRLAAAAEEQARLNAEVAALEDTFKKSIEAEKLVAVRQRIKNIDECDKNLDLIYKSEDYIKGAELCEEDTIRAKTAEERLDALKSETAETDIGADEEMLLKKSSHASLTMGAGGSLAVAAAAASVVLFVIKAYAFAMCALIIFVLGILAVVLGIRTAADCKNIRDRLDEKRRQIQTEEKNRRDEEQRLRTEYEKLLTRFGVSDAAELSRLYIRRLGLAERARNLESAKKGFLGDDTYEDLLAAAQGDTDEVIPAAEIEKLLAQKRKRQLELASEIKGLESKMAYEVKLFTLPADIDTELNAIENEIKECERSLAVIEAAESAISEASEVFRLSFAPVLNNRVDAIVGRLTDEKYSGIRVSEDYRMRVPSENGLYDAEYFSCGTHGQLYLALRIAAAELVCENAPLFLDDILTVYDNERALAAIKLLNDISKTRQTLVFTCHISDRENAEAAGVNIINIE